MNRLVRWKYLALLLTLVLLVVVYPVLHEVFSARLLFDILFTVVFVAAFQVVFTERKLRIAAFVLGIPTMIGAWSGYVLPGLPQFHLAIVFYIFAAMFFVLTAAAILRGIYKEEFITIDSMFGAFCGYFLIGLAFGHVYGFLESVAPGSFRATPEFAPQIQDEDQRHFVMTYFSFVTLTTLGYGDIVPATSTARSWGIVEAIMGQFYIAVLIAELIGKRSAQPHAHKRE